MSSDYSSIPLHRASTKFYYKLEEILQQAADNRIPTGWEALAEKIGVQPPTIRDWETKYAANPHKRVSAFLHHVVYEAKGKDDLTIGRMEYLAERIGNRRIVTAFEKIKEALIREGRHPIIEHSEPPLAVFNMTAYTCVAWLAKYRIFIYSIFMFVCIVHFLYTLWIINEQDRSYLHPALVHLKLVMMFVNGVSFNSVSMMIFVYQLFEISKIPEGLLKHKVLKLLHARPELLRLLFKEVANEEIKDTDIVGYALTTLNYKLLCLCPSALIFSIFIPAFAYKAGGFSYHSEYAAVWDAFSCFVTYFVINQLYCFYIYEYRLMKYLHELVPLGDRAELKNVNIKHLAQDAFELVLKRWKWLHYYTAFMIVFFITLTSIHWIFNLPFTLTCLPFQTGYSHRDWLYFVLIILTASVLNFIYKENNLRATKVTSSIFCLVILFIRNSDLEGIIGAEKVRLHVLLYAVPLISLSCIAWTLHRLHFFIHRDGEGEGGERVRGKYTRVSILFAFLSMLGLVCTIVAVALEYLFVRNGRTSTIALCNTDINFLAHCIDAA